jgi:hypothetical protein
MDCDQVFMILTRGPFPTGEPSDEDVESHLEYCADCWRLAEALRPALEVFQEAVPPAEGRDLPGYWGDARPSSLAVAHLIQSSTRTANATKAPEVRPTRTGHFTHALTNELSTDVVRAVAIAATMTAAVLVLVSIFGG